jgi:hypothetical protein
MVCICEPGFTGKGNVQCNKISKVFNLLLRLSVSFNFGNSFQLHPLKLVALLIQSAHPLRLAGVDHASILVLLRIHAVPGPHALFRATDPNVPVLQE